MTPYGAPDPVDEWFTDYVGALRGMEAVLRLAGLDPGDQRFPGLAAVLVNELVTELGDLFAVPERPEGA